MGRRKKLDWQSALKAEIEKHREEAQNLYSKAQQEWAVAESLERAFKRTLKGIAVEEPKPESRPATPPQPVASDSSVSPLPSQTEPPKTAAGTSMNMVKLVVDKQTARFKVHDIQDAVHRDFNTELPYLTVQSYLRRLKPHVQKVGRGLYERLALGSNGKEENQTAQRS
ncbi:MAG: hypothetical protein ABSD31_15620 [Candidatus Binataceae bacterium]|jgi:hypothetical protein